MKTETHQVDSIDQLETLFSSSKDSTFLPDSAYQQSILGNQTHLTSMPIYILTFPPYPELAEQCGMTNFSVKRSPDTGRFYLWNVNLGGHYPRLELRPVKLDHLLDIDLMHRYHSNWGYELGLNVSKDFTYVI